MKNNKQEWEKKFDNTIGLGFDQTDEDTQDFYKDIKQFIQKTLKNQEERLYKLEEIRCQEAVQKEINELDEFIKKTKPIIIN